MNVLVIGSGAREHALVWKIAQSHHIQQIYVAAGNAGTATLAQNLDVSPTDFDGLLKAAREKNIDLTVVGPEAPLASGIVDYFRGKGQSILGPTQKAAQIEASKAFAKDLMQRYGIPCAQSVAFSDYEQAIEYVKTQQPPIVVKADGLAAGKGVVIASSLKDALDALYDIMVKKIFGEAGDLVVVEEYLDGKEVSLLVFTDGATVVPMVPACDYKRVFDNDEGPNTGGMGCYSPPGFFCDAMVKQVMETILVPTVKALAAEGASYKGALYAGIIITENGPKVLEYNARFGDPETQVILPRLKSDLIDIFLAVDEDRLDEMNIEWRDEACVGVVVASGGYPGRFKKGLPIEGLESVSNDIVVFHAGTATDGADGTVRTDGGRVLTVTASGRTMAEARNRVYHEIDKVTFEGCHYRTDIAAREVI